MEKIIYESKSDRYNVPNQDVHKSIEELEENSNKIKYTFNKLDSRNDSRIIIKRIRERSESQMKIIKKYV